MWRISYIPLNRYYKFQVHYELLKRKRGNQRAGYLSDSPPSTTIPEPIHHSRSSAILSCTLASLSDLVSFLARYLSDSFFHSSLLFLGPSSSDFRKGSSRIFWCTSV